MIVEYHRPTQLNEALALLARTEPATIPIGGGSALDRTALRPFAVVDLQALGLNTLQDKGRELALGAALTLQRLADEIEARQDGVLADLRKAILHEAAYNLRQVGSVAGTLVAADGRSPFTTAMLALDATLTLQPDEVPVSLGDLLPLRAEKLPHRLITTVTIPLNAHLAYGYVARSPADRPIVCVGAALWPSGRTRVALGGFGEAPMLAFDGSEAQGCEAAARNAYSQAVDQWASAEYRQEIAGILTKRAVESLVSRQEQF